MKSRPPEKSNNNASDAIEALTDYGHRSGGKATLFTPGGHQTCCFRGVYHAESMLGTLPPLTVACHALPADELLAQQGWVVIPVARTSVIFTAQTGWYFSPSSLYELPHTLLPTTDFALRPPRSEFLLAARHWTGWNGYPLHTRLLLCSSRCKARAHIYRRVFGCHHHSYECTARDGC